MDKNKIIVEGLENIGSFYEIEDYMVQGERYRLLESNKFGEEYTVITNKDYKFICKSYDGIEDLYSYLDI